MRRALATALSLAVIGCGVSPLAEAARPGAPPPGKASGPVARHVVLVVIDGLRPDAIDASHAPNLEALARAGAMLPARAVGIPETLPGLVTIVTGLAPDAHHVTHDDDRGGTLPLPTLFTVVHAAGGRTALYMGKSKLALLAPGGAADVTHGPLPLNKEWHEGKDATLAGHFAQEFPAQRFAFALVHLRAPDYVGHDSGWMSERYLDAVRESDAAVGVIREAVTNSDVADSTFIMVTADHGGEGTRHWAGSEISWKVPLICTGPGKPGIPDAGAAALLSDVAPTVLAILGLPALPGASGHVIEACVPK